MRCSCFVLIACLALLTPENLVPPAFAQTPPVTDGATVDLGALRERAIAAFDAGRWDEAAALYEQLATADPGEWRFAFRLGHALLMTGAYDRSIAASRAAAAAGAPPAALYNIACAEARAGRADQALQSLEEALIAGFDGIDRVSADPDLASLRDDPRLEVLLDRMAAAERAAHPPFTWENVAERMEQAEAEGFSGSLHLVREGRVVLSRGYGLANREQQIPATEETIYAIGSTPIDFTRAGILLLAQEGRLSLDDPITTWFPNVPPDKQAITVHHLMTGGSGLRNFHDRPSDPNPDHTYIDRAEALRRIFEEPLLFPPGTASEHSHSAWGVLAAIIEVVSGRSYPDFTRDRLFAPAGLHDTGFFGEPIPEERLAVGYGMDAGAPVNAAPYWGPTSWLVMGSGGMTSTVTDLARWMEAVRSGRILRPEWIDRYFVAPGSLLEGGDMFGFGIVYTDALGTYFVLATNAHGPETDRQWRRLQNALAGLTRGKPSPYALGIQMQVESDGDVIVQQVLPEGAAASAGMQEGDRLVTANGRPLSGNPRATLDPLLQTGDPLEFAIERGDAPMTIRVTPQRRDSGN